MVGPVEVEHIVRVLAAHEPETLSREGKRRAAVALILRAGDTGPEVLFIERARHERDPWSGHMAFPGGRVDPGDAHPRATAERETYEEVGIKLDSARHIGRLTDLAGRGAAQQQQLVISSYVYLLEQQAPLAIDRTEVAQAFWFPLRGLLEPARHVPHTTPGVTMDFPGILVGEPGRHVVWGLTYAFLEDFFGIVGTPLPSRWVVERDELVE
jgi:8-oxo-dGTP pyrophosphatase MutT (NUDIX family)